MDQAKCTFFFLESIQFYFLCFKIVALVKSRYFLHPCETKQWSGIRFTEPLCDSWSKFEFYEVKTFAEWNFYWRAWNNHCLWRILGFIWLHWHHVWISSQNSVLAEMSCLMKAGCILNQSVKSALPYHTGRKVAACLQSQALSWTAIPKQRHDHKWSFFSMNRGVIYSLRSPLIVWSKII